MSSEPNQVQGNWAALLWAIGGASVLAEQAALLAIFRDGPQKCLTPGVRSVSVVSEWPIITGQFFESHSLKLHPRGVFLFSWIFFLSRRSSLSYSDLRRSMLQGQSPTCWILFILLSLSAHQIKDDRGPELRRIHLAMIFALC